MAELPTGHIASPVGDVVGGSLRRFLLEGQPVRGHWVELSAAWQELRGLHRYPPELDVLLGEAVAASVLLAATLKFEGRLTLQFAGNGAVRLLVAQCTHDFRVRAVAEARPERPLRGASFAALIGDGRLVVTVEPVGRPRYQGIVPLEGATLAGCMEAYFTSSEQLPTRLRLEATPERCCGLLMQRLPDAALGDGAALAAEQAWRDVQAGLAALNIGALTATAAEFWLPQLCAPHDCRLFAPQPVCFHCGCSMQRVGDLLRSMGEAEARAVLAEQGALTVTCEFCGRPYRFDSSDVTRLFIANVVPDVGRTLN